MSVVHLTVPLELADGGTAYNGTTTGLGDLFVVNTTGYNSISVQLSNTWVATVTFSISNDGTSWTPIATAVSNGTTIYPTTGIYFKASVTSYTSGQVNALAYLRFQPVADITVSADLTQLNANTAATATNTGTTATNTTQANVYLQQIADEIGETSVPITGSLGANGTLLSTQTLGYSSISVQIFNAWEANVVFQSSNDNVNWVNTQGYAFNSTVNSIDTVVNNDIYILPVVGRYFQAIVTNYISGTVSAVAYLRNQSLAGLGEAALTQAMDASTGTPLNVTYAGIQGAGQQPATNSMPVALANEQILDKWVVGKQYIGSVSVNTDLALDAASVGNSQAQPLDCLQYRSISFQFFQSAAVTAGVIALEASNDGLTWTSYPFYTASTNGLGGQITSITLSTAGGQTLFYEAPIYLRYFRFRVSTAIASTSTQIQAWFRLSMAPYTKYNQSAINMVQLNGVSVPSGSGPTSASAYSSLNAIMPIGGTDRSIVRSEFIGAPSALLTTQYTAGPYARSGYTDLAGAMGVSGPQPFLAEDKTYPVNVRLERSTLGQDSVQDLLQQILVELKALNYYTRETPNALNSGQLVSMLDDPENFFDDPTLHQLKKGH